jgi:GNAT superfamily N-acetyltransferase
MPIEIIPSDQEEQAAADFLQGRIREFNNAHSPHHRAIREEGAVTPLFLLLKDEAGELIGGLSGSTYWGWLCVDYLFVPEELRGRGLGVQLLEKAEAIALRRGCEHAYLTTFGFQAPGFYEKQGYIQAGCLQDYPPGVTYHWMCKNLKARAGS